MNEPPVTPAPFPNQTAWSVVLNAVDRTSPAWRSRLDALARLYWKPVCSYLARQWKLSREDAADVTQEFFTRLTESDALRDASPERGRFRTFLRLKLRDLVVDELRRRSRQKRGGDVQILPLDAPGKGDEPRWQGLSPADAFDRNWAACVLTAAIQELEAGYAGREPAFRAFMACAVETPLKSYHECAESLGIKESDVRNYVHRARQQLVAIVRRLVRDSVENDPESDDEVAYLLGLLDR